MDAQQQAQSSIASQGRRKRFSQRNIIIAIIIVVALIISIAFTLSSLNVFPNSVAGIITGIATVLGAAFALKTIIPDHTKDTLPAGKTDKPASSSLPSHPSEPPVPSTPDDKPTPRGIVGFPPPTDPRTIQQREQAVQDVYAKLTQPGISAIVLTGIGGQGKSTLAALVYRYTETQQRAGHSYFTAPPLWLRIDPVVTLADILTNVCDALKVSTPDIASLSPENQAFALFNVLNSVDQPRLVVLDQFENVLDDEGRARDDRPGIGEFLDALNSNPCACRVLLTSRPDPQGTRDYPSTCLLIYPVEGLSEAEGVELLRKWQVNATEADMRAAVKRCNGHALSLTLLASLLQKRRLSLSALLNDAQLWKGNLAKKLLDDIYRELDGSQRKLLAAFSVYREPVPVEAALAVASDISITKSKAETVIDALLAQHLLDAKDEGLYQPHAIVAEYARDHIVAGDEQPNRQALLAAHARAAHYYLEQAKTMCPPREQRRNVSDVKDLVEAIWQYCMAEQWQEAYELMEEESIFADVNRWGGNTILLELYQLLEAGHWQPVSIQRARLSYDLGWIHKELGHSQQALRYLGQALAIYRDEGSQVNESNTLIHLGAVYDALGQKQEALRYFEQALAIRREVSDRSGEAYTLWNIGALYFSNTRYDIALACFLLARDIFEEVQSPNRDKVQEEWIDDLREEVGEERYNALLAEVEPRAREIVDEALREGGML